MFFVYFESVFVLFRDKYFFLGLFYIVSIFIRVYCFYKDEEMLRGRFCERLFFVFVVFRLDFIFFFVVENGKFSFIIRCIFFFYWIYNL